uniref:Centrosomal protein of 41 kDa n=1 Tax=Caligus rogercresseyi TaxID=217165 RepID=C1BMR5_CALRO|nr:Centrosomal protein of 41 kDa [Caligus rogercresseyi]
MYPRRSPSKKISPLEKRVKPNPKYAGVESVVNSGNNLRKEIERMEEIRTFYRYRSNEIFRRIKITSLVQLMIEVAKVELQERELNKKSVIPTHEEEEQRESFREDESLFNHTEGELIDSIVDHRRQISTRTRSDLQSSLGDLMSDRDLGEPESPKNVIIEDKYSRPFLILDVRDEVDFNGGRGALIHSENYPLSRLTRSVNFESESMLRFKIPGKRRRIIVIVDEDESLSSKMATTLVERGYTNIFPLSGGLKVARILFPEKLIGTFDEERNNYLSSQDEGDIMLLETLCDEASSRGRSSRLSSYAPSRASVSLTRSYRPVDRFNGIY